VMSVAHGGQVLVSGEAARALGRDAPLLDLGFHRLKDLPDPEHLFQFLGDGLEREFPRLRSLNRSNLPTPPGSLIGRGSEMERALGLLERAETRVLTLLGAGGVGKTRLAMDVAAEAAGRYRDGVWIVFLAPIAKRALMVSEIARVLEVDQVEGRSLEESLASALSDRELLLVLDNLEHLPAAADVVAGVVAGSPGVDVLATSRAPLRIRGEQRLDVLPLRLTDSAELFLIRAQAVRPELVIDGEGRAAVELICERLDGLPLAIELAAARTAIFSPRALEARLRERLTLPEGACDLPARQRTLRATIDWSYRLLDPAERELFAAVSAFIGGVRADSAERVWGADALDPLVALTEKSLLRRRDDADGETRFWMLGTVLEFARERASAEGRAEAAAASHADYFAWLAAEAEPQLIGPDQARWLDRLEDDHVNLRAALEWMTNRDPGRAVKLAGELTWFWTIRGYAPEAARRLDAVLASAPADAPGRALAVYGASDMAVQLHDMQRAHELLQHAVELARAQGNMRLASIALSHLAWTSGNQGDQNAMQALHEEAIATARRAGDDWALAIALNNYAIAQSLRGDIERHQAMLKHALETVRPTRDLFMIALIANNLAEAFLDSGDSKAAEALSAEALELARRIKLRWVVSQALVVQAIIAFGRTDLEHTRTLLADAIYASSPYAVEPDSLLLAVAGGFAAATRQATLAARLWGAAERARERIDLEETPKYAALRQPWQPAAMTALGDDAAWDAAWKAGAALSIDDALALAQTATAVSPGVPANDSTR
jgi:predicted ATPase